MTTKEMLQKENEGLRRRIAELEIELKKAEPSKLHHAANMQDEEKLRQLLDILPVGISILDADRKVVFQNFALSQILRMDEEGLKAGAYKNRQYLAADGTPMSADGFASVQAEKSGRAVYNVETGVIKEDGETIWMSVSAVPVDFPGWTTVIVTTDITELKQLEQNLQDSEQRYTLLFQKSSIPVFLLKRPEVVIADANEAAEKLTGFTREEMRGKTAAQLGLISSTQREETIQKFEKEKALADNEMRIITKFGEERVILINTNSLEIDGQPYAITSMQDITERKRAEVALQQSQENFARAFEVNPTALAITRRVDGKFIVINAAYTSIMGYGASEIIGHTVAEFSIYADPQARAQLLKTFAEQGRVGNQELSVRRKGQELCNILVSMESIIYNDEDCILSAFVDITERKQAEETLRLNEERLRLSLQAANQGLYDLNVQTGETVVNDEYALMLGYDPASFHETNRFWIERLHPDDKGITAWAYNDYVEGRLPEYRVEFRQKTRAGEWKWILSLGKLVEWDEEGNPLRMLGTHTDINSRKLMENELRRSNTELEQFAYIASHDLQEPLRAVAGMVQLLQKRYEGQLDARADEYIGHAVEAANRMQSLISDLLTYSRVDRRNQSITMIDSGECLQNALKNLNVSIQESHAVISVDAMPSVFADSTQLTQLFQNLIGNSIKFRGKNEPHIQIAVSQTGNAWQFAVQDNGIGIEPQYFERIFLIFQRLHTRREYSGNGIGLALCKKIVERHGGKIWVESTSNAGTTFYFTIPLRII